MVKARDKINPSHPASLADRLKAEGQRLLGFKRLIQKTPVVPIQIMPISGTVDHLLLPVGAKVAVLSPDEGMAARLYAQKRPHWNIISWVPDAKSLLRVQNQTGESGNLVFDRAPTTDQAFDLDAVIATGWAHQVYSQNHYTFTALVDGVRRILAHVPDHAQIVIQDFALPDDADRFVLLDLMDDEARAALEEFSIKARPQAASPLQGFFLEKLASPRAGVARYRLAYKWAVEFFQRWRLGVSPAAPYELTTLSVEQWAALAEQAGGRALYRAPHALDAEEVREIGDNFVFLDENETRLPLPPASFTLLVEKVPATLALAAYERRPSGGAVQNVAVSSVKNSTGVKQDWVEIADKTDDILVWRFDEEKRLRVWVRTGVARPIMNTVARGTPNLDGRRWAGYITEPLAFPAMDGRPAFDLIADMLRDELGLPIAAVKEVRAGIRYYPAPEYLFQRVRGIFVRVNQGVPAHDPILNGINQGSVVELLADDVLRALSVGLIPDGKLEILLGKLLHDLGLKSDESGAFLNRPDLERMVIKSKELSEVEEAKKVKDGSHLAEHMATHVRAVRSVFVEDQVTPMGRQAIEIAEHDFIMPGNLSANTVICVPLMRNPENQFVFAAEPRQMDVPKRHGDEAPLPTLLRFRLPENVRNLKEAREFIAEKLECDVADVASFGPSFFQQPNISPERVYPFLVRATNDLTINAQWYRLKGGLPRLLEPPAEKNMAYVEFAAARALGEWVMGFGPEVTNHLARDQHPAAKTTPSIASAPLDPVVRRNIYKLS